MWRWEDGWRREVERVEEVLLRGEVSTSPGKWFAAGAVVAVVVVGVAWVCEDGREAS
jgi:hypothetical protein